MSPTVPTRDSHKPQLCSWYCAHIFFCFMQRSNISGVPSPRQFQLGILTSLSFVLGIVLASSFVNTSAFIFLKSYFSFALEPCYIFQSSVVLGLDFPFFSCNFFPSSFPYYNISQALTQSGLCAYLNICLCLWASLSGLLRTGVFISALNWVGWPTRDKASSIAFFPPLFFFF